MKNIFFNNSSAEIDMDLVSRILDADDKNIGDKKLHEIYKNYIKNEI